MVWHLLRKNCHLGWLRWHSVIMEQFFCRKQCSLKCLKRSIILHSIRTMLVLLWLTEHRNIIRLLVSKYAVSHNHTSSEVWSIQWLLKLNSSPNVHFTRVWFWFNIFVFVSYFFFRWFIYTWIYISNYVYLNPVFKKIKKKLLFRVLFTCVVSIYRYRH